MFDQLLKEKKQLEVVNMRSAEIQKKKDEFIREKLNPRSQRKSEAKKKKWRI